MDLPCAQWQDHVAQKWNALGQDMKKQFICQLTTDTIFKCALSLTTQEDLNYLQLIAADFPVEKDAEKACRCRERGNTCFKTRDYSAAARHYSMGVCFALPCTEPLSLCYANRSAALYHLQHYQECLDDIDRAEKSGYPSHLLHKLEGRRAQCLGHLAEARTPDAAHHAASKVETRPKASVDFNSEKGRHLVAKERIAAGAVILTDSPYSCVLIPGSGKEAKRDSEAGLLFGTEHRCCHRCLAETLCLVPCEGCNYSRYCSASCREEAWEEHHRLECGLGAHLRVMGVMLHLALRVTLKAGMKNIQLAREHVRSNPSSATVSQSGPHHGDSYSSVLNLLHHLENHSPSVIFLYAVTVAAMYLNLSSSGPLSAPWDLSTCSSLSSTNEEGHTYSSSEMCLLGSTALRHMLQLRTNAQAIIVLQDTGVTNSMVQASQEVRIATAIFPTLSLLNHSCCPNTSLVFSTGTTVEPSDPGVSKDRGSGSKGVTVTVRAAKDIAAGQEILHCYGPHSKRMAAKERQRLLVDQYYFLCQCEACSLSKHKEDENGPEEKGRWSGLLCGKCKGALKINADDGGTALTCMQPSCGLSMQPSELKCYLQEVRANLKKSVDLMERERPEEALKLLRRTQRHSGLIMAETQPLHGELEDATARAYAAMGDWKNAASHLESSANTIAHQYGQDSVELGHQLFKLAQLHFNGGARGPALSTIAQARPLLRLHCGAQCPELEELQEMEECLRG